MIINNTIIKIINCLCAQQPNNYYEKIDLLSKKNKIENSMNYKNLEVCSDYDIIEVKDL